jgi:hypothetical protein
MTHYHVNSRLSENLNVLIITTKRLDDISCLAGSELILGDVLLGTGIVKYVFFLNRFNLGAVGVFSREAVTLKKMLLQSLHVSFVLEDTDGREGIVVDWWQRR